LKIFQNTKPFFPVSDKMLDSVTQRKVPLWDWSKQVVQHKYGLIWAWLKPSAKASNCARVKPVSALHFHLFF
jgi:hypothetical protein